VIVPVQQTVRANSIAAPTETSKATERNEWKARKEPATSEPTKIAHRVHGPPAICLAHRAWAAIAVAASAAAAVEAVAAVADVNRSF